MSDAESVRIPKYRLHKPTGLGLVRIKGRDFYLGKHGTQESLQAYRRIISEWLANGRQALSPTPAPNAVATDLTINELFLAYWNFAEGYYVKNGRPTGELHNIRDACRPLNDLYGATPIREFGPRSLKAVRQRMIDSDLCRTVINARVHRIRRMFRWGVENEMVDANVLHALRAVAPLKPGRSAARDSEGVRPVPEAQVEAVLRFVPEPVAAMIQVQMLTGMRPGEVTIMRGCDLDTSGRVWVYRPAWHKTEHHCHDRVIYIGPRAQQMLRPVLKGDPKAYLFNPAEADAERRVVRHRARTTPLSCGNRPGLRRQRRPKRAYNDHYTPGSYYRAIQYACERAFRPPGHLARDENETIQEWKDRLTEHDRKELKAWRRAHSWYPHQLRHNAATRLRKEFGIEAARVVLGHRSAGVTEIYAEIDRVRAADVMAEVG
ncbi:MAG TPA: tyrosine-type recombinase/integrase [Phycisphaerae bacterium]|nr:tyrosine-type recombinase/integrase [Phycisphaerae bacterium]HRY70414.1 tyrosine-type recombinase/integrase [Phycisphaerae bacterium]HSA28131.1 tyrosine-type recombinase/integrase [Phycisphaerae bacterium]